jgi:hypothetical protein
VPNFDTATNIINSAGHESGLWTEVVSDPFASTDANVLQMCHLLNRVGKALVRARDWSHLIVQHEDTTDGDESFEFPADFNRLRDGTVWNTTTSLPMKAIASGSEWQALKNSTAASALGRVYRVMGNVFYIWPVVGPTEEEDYAMEYVSGWWVGDISSPTVPNLAASTAGTDVLFFDEALLVSGVKLAFARLKNRDTTALQAEYDEAWSAAAGGDSSAPIISMATLPGPMLLGSGNIPDTGFGG